MHLSNADNQQEGLGCENPPLSGCGIWSVEIAVVIMLASVASENPCVCSNIIYAGRESGITVGSWIEV
jgi:hypothetical protein